MPASRLGRPRHLAASGGSWRNLLFWSFARASVAGLQGQNPPLYICVLCVYLCVCVCMFVCVVVCVCVFVCGCVWLFVWLFVCVIVFVIARLFVVADVGDVCCFVCLRD